MSVRAASVLGQFETLFWAWGPVTQWDHRSDFCRARGQGDTFPSGPLAIAPSPWGLQIEYLVYWSLDQTLEEAEK
jgi:hypothetical protein